LQDYTLAIILGREREVFTFLVRIWTAVFSSSCPEEEMLVDFEKTFSPKQIFIHDIVGYNFSCNSFGNK